MAGGVGGKLGYRVVGKPWDKNREERVGRPLEFCWTIKRTLGRPGSGHPEVSEDLRKTGSVGVLRSPGQASDLGAGDWKEGRGGEAVKPLGNVDPS